MLINTSRQWRVRESSGLETSQKVTAKGKAMEYFQIHNNARQVVRIFRGPYEGLDLTRIQLWYKNPEDDDYKPGRIVAFASELIPGVIERLMRMSVCEPSIDIGVAIACALSDNYLDLMQAHKRSLH